MRPVASGRSGHTPCPIRAETNPGSPGGGGSRPPRVATHGEPVRRRSVRHRRRCAGRVLAAWTDSPARFREDANAEEDLVRGGYRDRLLVELAQNAADAALRAGVPGRLRLELTGGGGPLLRAANTGAPLDAAGVQGLATLRASAKRDEPDGVGRFGVGFAAVLAVTDEPAVLSTTGGVRFSAARTRAAVAAVPDLAAELASRDGAVPVLRLPEPADGAPPEGFDTEVVLPLRPGARDDVAAALTGLRADLLLALPGLAEIEVRRSTAVRRVLTRRARRRCSGSPTATSSTRWAVAEPAPGSCPPSCSPAGRSRSGPGGPGR